MLFNRALTNGPDQTLTEIFLIEVYGTKIIPLRHICIKIVTSLN